MTSKATGKNNAEIFSEIYTNKIWGKSSTGEKFYSGLGSHYKKYAVPYMDLLIRLLTTNKIRNIVDLGCGDFWIMLNVLEFLSQDGYNFFYTGIDVVEDLINHNVATFKHPNIRFLCMDAAADNEPLPDGDILIVRQVFQHLSNADIKKILGKAANFKFLFVTEHIYDGEDAVHNIDMTSGHEIRGAFKSGVFLEHAPYNYKNIVHLLKVPVENEIGEVIRSSLIIN